MCFLFAVQNSRCMCSQDLASGYRVKVVSYEYLKWNLNIYLFFDNYMCDFF